MKRTYDKLGVKPKTLPEIKRLRIEGAALKAEREAAKAAIATIKPSIPRPFATALTILNPLTVIERLINAQPPRSEPISLVPRILKRLIMATYYGNSASALSVADHIAKGALFKFYLPLAMGEGFVNWLTGERNNFVDTHSQSSTETMFRQVIANLLPPNASPPLYNKNFALTAGSHLQIAYWGSPLQVYAKVEVCMGTMRSPLTQGSNILQINFLRNIDGLQAVFGMSSEKYQSKMLHERIPSRRLTHAERIAAKPKLLSPLKQRLNASQLSDASQSSQVSV
jgi:hypothetical protein